MDALLLTGAGGYLGSRVACALRRAGRAFDVLPGRLEDIVPGSLPHRTVIHCAGKTSGSSPTDLERANRHGTDCLLAGLGVGRGRRPGPAARLVFVSTRKVYPQPDDGAAALTEAHPPAPWDAYGASKLAAEDAIRASGLPYVLFRAGSMFGHPTQTRKFPDQALRAALADRPVTLATPPRQEDYLDVERMAALLLLAAQDGPHWNHTFNVTGPVRDLAALVDGLCQAWHALRATPLALRTAPFPVPRFPWLDNGKLDAFFPACRQLDDRQIFRRMLLAADAG